MAPSVSRMTPFNEVPEGLKIFHQYVLIPENREEHVRIDYESLLFAIVVHK